MDLWLFWVIVGFVLVTAELATGTFYLLMLGAGAFAAALIAWLDANVVVQAVVGGGVALMGAWFVHHWHAANRKADAGHANLLDRGQPVVLEGWSNESAGIARVKYRGASWDARLSEAASRPTPGSTLYIESQEGGMLVVAAAPPR
jgi:membrane protein implicated in regulation of membrane protease activity